MRVAVKAAHRSSMLKLFITIAGLVPAGAPVDAQSVRLVKELTISGTKEEFVEIDQLALRYDGTLAILQRSSGSVQVYSLKGTFAYSAGRSGSGPGELRSPLRMGWLGDTLWVYDSNLRRVTDFLPSGILLRSTPVPKEVVSASVS
ncbi:MAG: hypothetical protein ABIV28_07720, partial [Longimicrobiales bacterium]